MMISLTQQDILAHQLVVPWPSLRQVEQDLLLCRAMVALFSDEFLSTQVAMRGGTLLHKVYLAPAARYSEDIDLVVIGNRPEDHVRKALRRVLVDVLGTPKVSAWDAIALAIRNTAKPSRILRMTYRVPSMSTPGASLEIAVEANVTERLSHQPIMRIPFEIPFRGVPMKTTINGYDIHMGKIIDLLDEIQQPGDIHETEQGGGNHHHAIHRGLGEKPPDAEPQHQQDQKAGFQIIRVRRTDVEDLAFRKVEEAAQHEEQPAKNAPFLKAG